MQMTLFELDTNMEVRSFNNQNKTSDISDVDISTYLKKTNANLLSSDEIDLSAKYKTQYSELFYKGDASLLKMPVVSVVGTRTPTSNGIKRTEKVVETLCENNFVIMSGLAKGVDTVAHEKTLQLNGKTIAILGTPIHKIYPAENKNLAKTISERGLLLSSTPPNQEVGRHLFPRRNRLMAVLSKATIIIEAGPTSGVIHQAAECLKQGRKLIFLQSLAERKDLPWVPKFLKSGAIVAKDSKHLIDLIND